MSLINLVSRNNIILLTLIAIFSLEACATKDLPKTTLIDEADLNFCVFNPELLVGASEGAVMKKLEIMHCNYIPSGGAVRVIIVKVDEQKFIFWDVVKLSAKIFSEYLFRKNGDLLLISYGWDSEDKGGNYYEYNLYRIGDPVVWESGTSLDRPRIRDLLKTDPIRD